MNAAGRQAIVLVEATRKNKYGQSFQGWVSRSFDDRTTSLVIQQRFTRVLLLYFVNKQRP